ncbi:MAG: aspartyl protease family protein [Treponema sp.]|nr:aspartyl protease family protein [Treponema sp.]
MMGMVFETITLKNAGDVANAERGYISEQEVRETTVSAVVDTGAFTLVISEEVREILGLRIRGTKKVTLANDKREVCTVTEPVEIHWKNRDTTLPAIVSSGWGKILLGALPLEDMDLMVDPVNQKLVGVHGDKIESYIL